MFIKSKPIAFDKPKHVVSYIIRPDNQCRNCRYRKEIFAIQPPACQECTNAKNWLKPYFILLPVWEETFVPNLHDIKIATKHGNYLRQFNITDLPSYCQLETSNTP